MKENVTVSSLHALTFAAKSAYSLTHDPRHLPLGVHRKVYEENAQTPESEPLNREELLFPKIVQILKKRAIKPPYQTSVYWDKNVTYDPVEVFGSVIQCFDQHCAELPFSVLPPETDIKKYIVGVKNRGEKVTIDQQLEILLDITDNNLIGAANIGWLASRIMARAADTRAYPGIKMDEDEIRAWNKSIAQFKTYDDTGTSEGPGDTYYFWTHVFAALIYSNKGIKAEVMKRAFKNGTDVMMFVRKHIAHKPNITSHHPASTLGKEIGLALANLED